jgi:hypothetical protein
MRLSTLLSSIVSLLACAGLFAAGPGARVDVYAKDGVVLNSIKAEGGWVAHPNWVKDPQAKESQLTSDFAASNEWRKGSLSFVPSKDGTASLVLMGRWAAEENDCLWVFFDDVEVEGATFVNGGFEDGSSSWYGGRNAASAFAARREAAPSPRASMRRIH